MAKTDWHVRSPTDYLSEKVEEAMKRQYIYWVVVDNGPAADPTVVECSSVHATRRAAERRVNKIISARYNALARRLDAKGRLHASSYAANSWNDLMKPTKFLPGMGDTKRKVGE